MAANGIYLMRLRILCTSGVRFLVFTGTSGKTLARTASVYALRKAGLPVVSPPYGYTNELGIVLAALGIESVHLLSLKGLWKVISSCPPSGAYICIELGADWRSDILWFLKRFKPFGVFIANTSAQEWTHTLEDIWSEKQMLIESIPQDGFLCWSAQNESVQKVRAMKTFEHKYRTLEYTASHDKVEFRYESSLGTYSFHSPLSDFIPYTEAFGCAIACMEILGKTSFLKADFFTEYRVFSDRFSYKNLVGGAVLISDTYKAVPLCVKYVLDFALALPARRRIAVVSAMHPIWLDEIVHYQNLAETLNLFDKSYFIGPEDIYALIKSYTPQVVYASQLHLEDIAKTLREESNPETVIVVKTAGRYHVERLVAKLLA